MLGLSTESLEGSPAREPAPPGNATGSSTPRRFCGGSSSDSFVTFDPGMCWWRTSQTSLLSTEELSGEKFSGTWPRSGFVSGGTVFRRLPLAPLTDVTGSSPLLPTPRASVDKDHGPNGKHWSELAPTVVGLLPMPTTNDAKNDTAPPGQSDRNSPGLPTVVTDLLPTPRADQRDASPRTPREGWRPSLMEAVQLLPTPNASVANDGERPETWLARAEKLKEKHGNGNGVGMPLSIAVQLLPTPTRNNDRQATAKNPRNGPGTSPTLGDVIHEWSESALTGESTPEPSKGGSTSSVPRLNPSFVEWMMGVPEGWTDPDCPLSAMEFKSRLVSSSGLSSNDSTEAR